METTETIALAALIIGFFLQRTEIMAIPLFVLCVCKFVKEQERAKLKQQSKTKNLK